MLIELFVQRTIARVVGGFVQSRHARGTHHSLLDTAAGTTDFTGVYLDAAPDHLESEIIEEYVVNKIRTSSPIKPHMFFSDKALDLMTTLAKRASHTANSLCTKINWAKHYDACEPPDSTFPSKRYLAERFKDPRKVTSEVIILLDGKLHWWKIDGEATEEPKPPIPCNRTISYGVCAALHSRRVNKSLPVTSDIAAILHSLYACTKNQVNTAMMAIIKPKATLPQVVETHSSAYHFGGDNIGSVGGDFSKDSLSHGAVQGNNSTVTNNFYQSPPPSKTTPKNDPSVLCPPTLPSTTASLDESAPIDSQSQPNYSLTGVMAYRDPNPSPKTAPTRYAAPSISLTKAGSFFEAVGGSHPSFRHWTHVLKDGMVGPLRGPFKFSTRAVSAQKWTRVKDELTGNSRILSIQVAVGMDNSGLPCGFIGLFTGFECHGIYDIMVPSNEINHWEGKHGLIVGLSATNLIAQPDDLSDTHKIALYRKSDIDPKVVLGDIERARVWVQEYAAVDESSSDCVDESSSDSEN